ncbi:MAG: cation:proton antiporter [Armatimonadetes bacterium]|nr:cation:proton antiporter [Armatimonadota bacterium]
MTLALAIAAGGLYAAGLYLLMRRSLMRLILGLSLLGQAANVLIFAAGRPVRGQAPLVAVYATAPSSPFSDPVPQALILTAIVIGFGTLAFAIVLLKRAHQAAETDDLDQMRGADA